MITVDMLENYLTHLHKKYNQNLEDYAPDFAGMGRVMIYNLDLAQAPNTWTRKAHSESPCPQLQIHENRLIVVDKSQEICPSQAQS